MTHEVKLAIYDLSQGMARTLSSQFLGPNHVIDIIPHTSIIAFGKEYYFGSMGVEGTDPMVFRTTRQLNPIQFDTLGQSNVSQTEFESWCRRVMENGLYAPSSYDLINRNCNHFTHHAATEGLRLQKGTPEWILNVPQRFMASPMGQMIRPMLQQMQITGPTGDGSNTIGFHANETSSTTNKGDSSSSSSKDSSNANATANPWAHLQSTKDSKKLSSSDTQPSLSSSKQPPTRKLETPTLDSYNRPLLSNDTNMVNVCVNKIRNGNVLNHLQTTQKQKLFESLDVLPVLLNGKTSNGMQSQLALHIDNLSCIIKLDDQAATQSEKTFTLMLLRLLILRKEIDSKTLTSTMEAMMTIINRDDSKHATTKNTALNSMAWCVISNAIGSEYIEKHQFCLKEHFLQTLVDSAVSALSSDQPAQVRQSSAAFLYNTILMLKKKNCLCGNKRPRTDDDDVEEKKEEGDDSVYDLYVSILCSVIEDVSDELDTTVLTRKLLIIGKILRESSGVNHTMVSLMMELGYRDALLAVRDAAEISQDQTSVVIDIAKEIVHMLPIV